MLFRSFSKSTDEILEKVFLFCSIWTVGTIFTETFFAEKQRKIISYGVTGGISLIFTQILTSSMAKSTGEIEITFRFLGAYAITLILLSIYKSIRNAELKFEEYILKLFRDLFNMTTTYIILNIGIMMLTAIFVQLILDGKWRKHVRTIIDTIVWAILCAIHGVQLFRDFQKGN